MNPVSEQEFMATVLKLLARNGRMTIGQIRNRTRAFRRRRRIANETVFKLLENYIDTGLIKHIEISGRVAYASCLMEKLIASKDQQKEIFIPEHLGMGTKTMSELAKHAYEWQAKRNAEKEHDELVAASYTPSKPPAINEQERRENEKARRAEHEAEIAKAETDPLAGLDEPEVNDGV